MVVGGDTNYTRSFTYFSFMTPISSHAITSLSTIELRAIIYQESILGTRKISLFNELHIPEVGWNQFHPYLVSNKVSFIKEKHREPVENGEREKSI
jgi:hypothetical protein